jgi:two-component system sensor histidine kinase KdpD
MTTPAREVKLSQVLTTTALVALATLGGVAARGHLADPDLVMLYLLVVVVAATRFGRVAALLASTLSVLAYDFFFVQPSFTFFVADERYLLTFATLFIVGVSISAVTESARAARLKAETEELRSSLLSSVSHDLRTPLATITGAATTLRERGDALTPQARDELAAAICEEAERLEVLVGNLLDMSRLQSGVLEVKREWVPVEELVGSALAAVEPALGARPVQVSLPSDLPLIAVDPVLFEQVLRNLLDNVAKYTPPSAAVELSAQAVRGGVELRVDDGGPGLQPRVAARVFEKFTRGEHPGAQGAGLGLAICRGIVEAHGGHLSASRSPLGGARFEISLPIVGEAPAVPSEPS